MKAPNIHITAYWEGYPEQNCNPLPLNQVSNKIDVIPIAFIAPAKNPASSSSLATTWEFDQSFVYTKEQILTWIREINERGANQKVLLSILDTGTCHWYPDVDIDAFARNIAADCDKYGIAGIDVDAESGMADAETHYVATFVQLIKALRKYLSDDKIITYTCYTQSQYDTQIIQECRHEIAYINTMAYWFDVSEQISLYHHYVEDIGDADKVAIGVKAGSGGDATALETVTACAQFLRDNDGINIKRMMLWSVTRDVQNITLQKDAVWLETIYANIIANTNIAALLQNIQQQQQCCNAKLLSDNRNILEQIEKFVGDDNLDWQVAEQQEEEEVEWIVIDDKKVVNVQSMFKYYCVLL